MTKRMSEDEVQEMAYKRLFGDLDSIESRALFDGEKMDEVGHTAPNAKPAMEGSGGVTITVEPIMKGAEEGARETDDSAADDEETKKDKLKGIGNMSPLMAQLHGGR